MTIELTSAQIAVLDLLIANKQTTFPSTTYTEGVNVYTMVGCHAVGCNTQVTWVGIAVGGDAASADKVPDAAATAAAMEKLDNMSLQQLKDLRSQVVAKQ